MRHELLALEPNLVFLDNQTMTTQVGATLLPAKFGAMSVSAVGVVAMLLAAIGLYGVIAYSVARRTREIGIRMALGARPSGVLGLILRQGMTVSGVGAVAGVVLAAGAAKAVSGALYRISPVDPIAWGGALGILLVVSVLANVAPARRASRVDPSIALRSE
jgi:putative ABC transport system permease protein